MGTETEYAVTAASTPYNPIRLSYDVVNAADGYAGIRWDYRPEHPVQDMRGFAMQRAAAPHDMLTDEAGDHVTNKVAANGGRVYVDHAHPEYSSPETLDPFAATVYNVAGDRIMRQAVEQANMRRDAADAIRLYKNNVDGKGATWGAHENYCMSRSVPFELVVDLMTAHLVSRQLYTGAGRVGLGDHGETAGYQLSQRADYFLTRVGLQTTLQRPIINTRDESHATDALRRLHVIAGDANRMDVPQVLKLGTTSMLLWLLEHADETAYDLDALLACVRLADPVDAMHRISHDLTLGEELELESGAATTAWTMQIHLLTAVYEACAAYYGTDTKGEPVWPDRDTKSVMAMWKQALLDVAQIRHANADERLELDGPATRIEWFCKWRLVERMKRRLYPGETGDEALADPRIAGIDLLWASLEPNSLYDKMRTRVEHTCSEEEIEHAMHEAPEDTRAWLRAAMVRRFPGDIAAASWSTLRVRTGEPDNALYDISMEDPADFTKERTRVMLADAHNVCEVLQSLQQYRDA